MRARSAAWADSQPRQDLFVLRAKRHASQRSVKLGAEIFRREADQFPA